MFKKIISFLLIFTINFVHLATPALVLAEELSSPTPAPSASSSPEPTPAASATPTPSATPVPFAEPASSPTSIASPTPEPSATPTATPEPTQDASPSANPTLNPSPTPEATSSASPTDRPENMAGSARETNSVLKQLDKKLVNKLKSKNGRYIDGEVLVKFKKDKINLNSFTSPVKTFLFNSSHNLEKGDEIKDQNVLVLKTSNDVQSTIDELKKDPNVEIVQPNYIKKVTSVSSNDPKFDQLWGLNNTGQWVNRKAGKNDADIDAPEAWDLEKAEQPDVLVAVLDTGIAVDHEDLKDNLWDGTNCKDENNDPIPGGCPNHGWDFYDSDNNPSDTYGHGTHVSGTIAATPNNSKGITGISNKNNIKVMALKIGPGPGISTLAELQAISFAKNNGAKIINASFGGGYDALEEQAIKSFPGLFVAAAGNGGYNNDESPFYPTSYDSQNIIAVAATDQNDNLADFSQYGVNSVDVGAPGVNILSSLPEISQTNYDEKESQYFNNLTPPAIPDGYTKTGDWGTKDISGSSNVSGGFGTVLYGDVNNIPYKNNADNIFTSPKVNLSGYDKGLMTFASRCDTEYKNDGYTDYVQLEISKDGENFQYLTRWDEYALDLINHDGYSPSGYAEANLQVEIPQEYANSNFRYRFVWHTNESESGDLGLGCFVDDISITGVKTTTTSEYDYWEGTSMATPHVVGEAAMIESYNPSLSNSQVKDVVLNSGDSLLSLKDKTVSGKRINLYNALVQSRQSANHAPVAGDLNISVTKDSPIAITLSATDEDNDNLTYSIVSSPSHGSLSQITNDQVTYTPNSNYTGPDSFTYKATDSKNADSNTATVSITVNGSNNAPVTTGSNVTTNEDTPIEITLNATDVDNDNLRYTVYTPAHGTVSDVVNGKVTYTPALNSNEPDSFTFKVNDGTVDSNTSTINITVTPVNDAPSITTVDYGPASPKTNDKVTVLPYGSDPDGDNLTYSYVWKKNGQVLEGEISNQLDLSKPGNGDKGDKISFTVTAKEETEEGLTSEPFNSHGDIEVINSAPNLGNDNVSVDEDSSVLTPVTDLIKNDSDPDSDPIYFTWVDNAKNGVVEYIQDQGIKFTPNKDFNGEANYDYTVSDGTDTTKGTVKVNVKPVNDAPVALNSEATITEDTPTTINLNITDVDQQGDFPIYEVVTPPQHGQLGKMANKQVTYIPAANGNGPDSFSYKVTDSEGAVSEVATVNITVNPVNDAPNITGIEITATDPKTDSILSAQTSADDVEGDNITFSFQWKKNGIDIKDEKENSLDLSKAGNGDKGDKISITVTASDGQDSTSVTSGEVTIGNTKPVAVNDTLLTTQNTALTFKASALAENDTDADTNDKLEVTAVSLLIPVDADLPTGEVTLIEGTITFTPRAGYIGEASLLYSISDGSPESTGYGSATINIIAELNSDETIIAPVVNVEIDKPQIVIGNTNVNSVINVPANVNNASLDTSSVLTPSGQATIPNNISVNTQSMNVAIPAGITVSGPSGWNGTITLPSTVSNSSVTPLASSGTTAQTTGVIEIGAGDTLLTLSKAVRLVIPGKAKSLAGFTRGSTFTAITAACSADSQEAGDALSEGAECKIDSGLDLVIWTKHFTKFVTYTETANTAPASGGTGGSDSSNSGSNNSAGAPVCGDTKPQSAPTLVSAVAGENSVTLTWSKALDPVTYYLVAYGTEKGKVQFGNPNIGDKNTTSYTVKNLSGGVTYYFKVRAGNNCMPGSFSNELSATPRGSATEGGATGFEEGVLGTGGANIEGSTPSADLEPSKSATEGPKKKGKSANKWLILAVVLGLIAIAYAYRNLKRNKNTPKRVEVNKKRKFTSRKKR